MAKIAFIFPGQGSQYPGMGKALYDAFPVSRAVIDAAAGALKGEIDLKALLFEGPEDALKLTVNTQPAILTVSLAALAALREKAPELAPVYVAGHSLGEYTALAAAGVAEVADAVRIVRERGRLMQEAVPEGVGTMAAILGLDGKTVEAVCAEVSREDALVSPANYNAPEQIVIAGHVAAVAEAGEKLKAAGAKRVLPLPVSAPFHCALMAPMQPGLDKVLRTVEGPLPKPPLVTNVEAKPETERERIGQLLLEQVVSPVRWVETVQFFAGEGVTHLIELGPGKVLTGLGKRIDASLSHLHVEDPDSLEKTLGVLREAA